MYDLAWRIYVFWSSVNKKSKLYTEKLLIDKEDVLEMIKKNFFIVLVSMSFKNYKATHPYHEEDMTKLTDDYAEDEEDSDAEDTEEIR